MSEHERIARSEETDPERRAAQPEIEGHRLVAHSDDEMDRRALNDEVDRRALNDDEGADVEGHRLKARGDDDEAGLRAMDDEGPDVEGHIRL